MLRAIANPAAIIDASNFPDLPTWRDISDEDSSFLLGVRQYAESDAARRIEDYDLFSWHPQLDGADGWMAALAMAHEERDHVWSDAEFDLALREFVSTGAEAWQVGCAFHAAMDALTGRLLAAVQCSQSNERIRRILVALHEHDLSYSTTLERHIHGLLARRAQEGHSP